MLEAMLQASVKMQVASDLDWKVYVGQQSRNACSMQAHASRILRLLCRIELPE